MDKNSNFWIVAQLKHQQAERMYQIMMNVKEECTTKPWLCQKSAP